MSEFAVFIIIRDGERKFYADRWADTHVYREIVWGPEDLENWLEEGPLEEECYDDSSSGVIVDHDRRVLSWTPRFEGPLELPRVAAAFRKLLVTAWPGFEVREIAQGMASLEAAAEGVDVMPGPSAEPGLIAGDGDEEIWGDRCDTVRMAAGIDEEQNETELDDYRFDEDDADGGSVHWDEGDRGCWVTVIDQDGVVQHRHVAEISQDVIRGAERVLDEYLSLPARELPPEIHLKEGIWFDTRKRVLGYWGNPFGQQALQHFQAGWRGWTVNWHADGGYESQCAASGPSGIPLSAPESIGQLAPVLLSTKRFDFQTIAGAIGGQLKTTAIKATGCLYVVLCLPILLFGLVSGDMRSVGTTILVMAGIIVVMFKIIETRVRRKFKEGPAAVLDRDEDRTNRKSPTTGPQDDRQRRNRLDELLMDAGLPRLADAEPHFVKGDTLHELVS